ADRSGPVRAGDVDAEAFGVRAFAGPEVDPERPLRLQRRVEHELARHDVPRPDVLGRPVRDDGHVVALPDEADGELEALLAAADDRDRAHVFPLLSLHQLRNGWIAPLRPERG